jgi:hypothetical protein
LRYAVAFICALLFLLLQVESAYAVENSVFSADSSALPARGVLRIAADQTAYGCGKKNVTCTGHVTVDIGGQDARLEADRASLDLEAAMLEARGNVKIWRNGQLTTGSSYKFKIQSDEYLITAKDGIINRLEVVTRTAGSAKESTVCRIDSLAYSLPDSNRAMSFDRSADLARVYGGPPPAFQMPAALKLFGQMADRSTKLCGVDEDCFGIKAYIGEFTMPNLGVAKWLRVGGRYGIQPNLNMKIAGYDAGFATNGIRGSFAEMGTGASMLAGTIELRKKLHLRGDNVVGKMMDNKVGLNNSRPSGRMFENLDMSILLTGNGVHPIKAVEKKIKGPICDFPLPGLRVNALRRQWHVAGESKYDLENSVKKDN